MTLPRTISQMTVDEVWRDLMGFCDDEPDAPLPPSQPQAQPQRQPTLGAMTLEEFLVRAGVVLEDMGGQTVVVPARAHAQAQAQTLFPPQGNVVATTMQMGNGVVGQAAGGGMTVAAPTTPVVLNGFGKMEGDDLSSLSPVPYPFDTAMRARKGPTVEKVVERRQRRMIKNRESAARSRQRKQVKLLFFFYCTIHLLICLLLNYSEMLSQVELRVSILGMPLATLFLRSDPTLPV
jgi:ABA responsive element binding factor